MAKIIDTKTLNLRTRFKIVKVQMDCVDPYTDVDFRFVESIVDGNSAYSGFRYITGVLYPLDNTYCTYWLLGLKPRLSISDKDVKMFKDIIKFSQF